MSAAISLATVKPTKHTGKLSDLNYDFLVKEYKRIISHAIKIDTSNKKPEFIVESFALDIVAVAAEELTKQEIIHYMKQGYLFQMKDKLYNAFMNEPRIIISIRRKKVSCLFKNTGGVN